MEFEATLWIPAPPEAVWPLLSDTERLNREMGLPGILFEFRPREAGGTETWATLRLAGLTLRYREHPFEWVRPAFYRIRRTFQGGPLQEFRGEVRLARETRGETAGTRVVNRVMLQPAGPVGSVIGSLLGRTAMRDFVFACHAFADYLERRAATPYPRNAAHPPADRARLERLRAMLQPFAVAPDLVERLIGYLEQAPPEDVALIRPFALADAWGRDRLEVLRACLLGARVGLLDLHWRLLCPSCRGAVQGLSVLRDLSATTHCETCNIHYDAEFDRSVEVCFAVPPAIRAVTTATYCVGGPGRTPHVAAQWALDPGEEREVWIDLPEGEYHLSSLQVGTHPLRVVAGEGGVVEVVVAEEAGVRSLSVDGEGAWAGAVPARTSWRVRNAAGTPLVLRLEEAVWRADVATAALVTALQTFRDLFSSEVLAPGVELSVRQVCILFSDLKGSTALYRQIGDAPSYRLVRDTFDLMRRVIDVHKGGIVKTIGDGVMASFTDPADGLAAALAIQQQLPVELPRALPIKLGLHWGPAIIVTANDLLDYFGQTVNLAARLRDQSEGRDIVFAAALAEDPRVARLLEEQGIVLEPFEAPVRGLEAPVAMARVRVNG